jgi:NADPH:quinone reductase-like Zn-dependent oxidoreductase
LKAVRLHAHGGVDQLRYEETGDPHSRSSHDALVRLKAASINRHEVSLRRGLLSVPVDLPRILGCDGAGTVIAAGSEVRNVKPGDPVCLYPAISCGGCELCRTQQEHFCGQRRLLGEREDGTYAECVSVPATNCYPMPQGLTFEEAAALPLVYSTAWRMLISEARLRPGESVLILGVGGGIASASLRVAASLGADVIVTSSSDQKLAKAEKHGARHGINYKTMDVAKEVRTLTNKRGVDVVVDCVAGDGWLTSFAALAKGGRLVTCGATADGNPQADLRRVFWNHLKVFGSMAGTREDFRQMLNFFAVARAKPIVDDVFPLKDAGKAHQRLEAGQQFGKIILSMDG